MFWIWLLYVVVVWFCESGFGLLVWGIVIDVWICFGFDVGGF